MSPITVLGSSGFIGRHLVEYLRQKGIPCFCPDPSSELRETSLGTVIYCIGLTADFRSRPLETVEAHVCKLLDVLKACEFDSLLYLSSTRVYGGAKSIAHEDDSLQVDPLDGDQLYNVSKIMGEALSLACGTKARVARLSNVYGVDIASPNFLSTIIRDAVSQGKVTIHSPPDAEKDYISIHDTVDGLVKIALEGKHAIYNLASGRNVSTRWLAEEVKKITGCELTFDPVTSQCSYPVVSVERIRDEFGFSPASLSDNLDKLIASYRDCQRG